MQRNSVLQLNAITKNGEIETGQEVCNSLSFRAPDVTFALTL